MEALYELYKKYPSVSTDTRKLQKNDIFFALTGPSFNGNDFAQTAIDRGASYVVIDDASYSIEGKTILVPDSLKALQDLAHHHRNKLDIPFIAITGSNGKTTTKELVHAVLSSTFKTYTTEGNLNNHIGVPLTILGIGNDAEMAVIEMGANHLGEIASYCRIAFPSHGLITNCGKAHLEGFGSEEGVRKAKGELFDHLRNNGGTAFIMNDYNYLVEMSKGIVKIFSYGTVEADVTGVIENADPYLCVRFTKGFEGSIETKLVGSYNLPNVLASVAIGKFFDVKEEKIREAIENYSPSNSRSQLLQKGSNRIILDAYNANPSSMKAAIENFARMDGDNKVLVLGSMAELGQDSLNEHNMLVNEIRKYPWREVILVGSEFEKTGHPFKGFSNSLEAGEWMKNKFDEAYLLIKGSRSARMEKVLEYL